MRIALVTLFILLSGCATTDRRLIGGQIEETGPICYVRAKHFAGFIPVDCREMEVIKP